MVQLLEFANVFAKGLYHLPTGFAGFHVVAIQTLGVVLVEAGFHRLDLLEFLTDGVYVLGFQHLGIHGCLIGILGIDIPGSENYIVKFCNGYDFIVFQVFLVCSASNTDFVILCHGTYRLGESFTGH